MGTGRRLFARMADGSFSVDLQPDGRAIVRPMSVGEATAPAPQGDGLAVAAQYLGHGRMHLTTGAQRVLAWVVDEGERRWVYVNGAVVQVEVADRPAGRPRPDKRAGVDTLTAPMPATVVRVLRGPGDAVARGAPILLLEAMKMELALRAPHDAVVRAVRCAEGDLVQPGAVLVDLDGV